MKNIFILSAMLLITSCLNHRTFDSVQQLVTNMPEGNNETISVKGYLKISETQKKALYLYPNSDVFLDLAMQLEILPREKYFPDTFYCVYVIGKYNQYTEDVIRLSNISQIGRIIVKHIEHCE